MLGSEIDLGKVDTDSYVVAGIADHLCKWESCYQTTQLLGGETEVRALHQRAHRRDGEPSRQPQGQLPDRVEEPGRRRRSGSPRRARSRAAGGTTTSTWLARAHRPASATSRPGWARRATSRSATRRAPTSMTAEPAVEVAHRPRPHDLGARHPGQGLGAPGERPAASTSRRCCSATASAPASRRSSRWSTHLDPDRGRGPVRRTRRRRQRAAAAPLPDRRRCPRG